VSAHAPPDDVRTGRAASTVLEGGTPVGSPGQLEDGLRAIHALHSQSRPKLTGAEVGDEDVGDSSEAKSFICRQIVSAVPPAYASGDSRRIWVPEGSRRMAAELMQ
jgi:hypothetical protein